MQNNNACSALGVPHGSVNVQRYFCHVSAEGIKGVATHVIVQEGCALQKCPSLQLCQHGQS